VLGTTAHAHISNPKPTTTMSRIKKKRHIAVQILFPVFLFFLVCVSFHTHQQENRSFDKCDECVSHNKHTGHYCEGNVTKHDCLLCQVGHQSYLIGQSLVDIIKKRPANIPPPAKAQKAEIGTQGSTRSRAPPV